MSDVTAVHNSTFFLPDKKAEPPKGLNDPETFLKILVAQLTHQDPMEPQDSATFVNQLTQMASMEQMLSMGKNMQNMADKYEIARYFDLIGQEVSLVSGNDLLTGLVGGVVFDQDQPYFYLENDPMGQIFTLDQVAMVTGKTTGSLLPYLALVGQTVRIKDDQQEIIGQVEKVLLHQGQAAVQVNGSVYGADLIVEVSAKPLETAPPAAPHDPAEPENAVPEQDEETGIEPEPVI